MSADVNRDPWCKTCSGILLDGKPHDAEECVRCLRAQRELLRDQLEMSQRWGGRRRAAARTWKRLSRNLWLERNDAREQRDMWIKAQRATEKERDEARSRAERAERERDDARRWAENAEQQDDMSRKLLAEVRASHAAAVERMGRYQEALEYVRPFLERERASSAELTVVRAALAGAAPQAPVSAPAVGDIPYNHLEAIGVRKAQAYVPPPDANCFTLANGDCVSEGPCMHTVPGVVEGTAAGVSESGAAATFERTPEAVLFDAEVKCDHGPGTTTPDGRLADPVQACVWCVVAEIREDRARLAALEDVAAKARDVAAYWPPTETEHQALRDALAALDARARR